MGLDLYFYRCKKDCYEQHQHNHKALSAEAQSAISRWMYQEYQKWGRPDYFEAAPGVVDGCRCPEESDNLILVDGWLQHTGSAYRWFLEHTAMTLDDAHPVRVPTEVIYALYKACETVLSLEMDVFGCTDIKTCSRLLPVMGNPYFGTDEYCWDYREEVEAVMDALNALLNTIDFETEVILVQANW